eukprot:g16203.t1
MILILRPGMMPDTRDSGNASESVLSEAVLAVQNSAERVQAMSRKHAAPISTALQPLSETRRNLRPVEIEVFQMVQELHTLELKS